MAAKTATADATKTTTAAPRPRRAAQNGSTGATTRTRRPKASTARTATPEETLAELAAQVVAAQVTLDHARSQRDAVVATMLADKLISGPKAAAALGVTTMAVYNMRNRAAK